MTLKEFTVSIVCSKCGLIDFSNGYVKYEYCNKHTGKIWCNEIIEHLHLHCSRCGYKWMMKTKESE